MKMKCVTIAQLQAIHCKDNGEPLVDLSSEILCDYRREDSDVSIILVRRTVAEKLHRVQQRLTLQDPQLQLLVTEGYRSPAYQESYFLNLLRTDPTLSLEEAHQLVALPSVAGHPTGGAIDLTLAYKGKEVEMGCAIADFTAVELLPTYSSLATPEQSKRRILLHDLMVAEGFAPFYGEWWHFSYGDREWAVFYDAPFAHYGPIS